jgi:regulator of protease activity HflC (stomatin/prohibitin superfamily)
MTAVLAAVVVVLFAVALLAGASIRVLREYERAVVFRLGRLMGERGPGLVLLIPGIDRMVRVSLRTVAMAVPPQDVITRDNVPARVDAVTYFRVVDPCASVVDIEDAVKATSQIAQTTLRSVLGKADLDALLSERERLNDDLQQMIDEQTEPWGIKVTAVEIKDVGIPSTMQRAMARQAEAERERRAKVIHAEGEFQAAAKLSDAAAVISQNPAAIQLRYMQTLSEMGDHASTIVFPLPIDLLKPLLGAAAGATSEGAGAPQPATATATAEPEAPQLAAGGPPASEALGNGRTEAARAG